jgi:hypothetical protein
MKFIPYALAVESIMYAQVCTHSDLAFVTGLLGRFQSNPGTKHWKDTKKTLWYLQGIKHYMLTYKKTDNIEVIDYLDSDFAGYADSQKSTSGYVFTLANGVMSWKSSKQRLTTSSMLYAEFITCFDALRQAMWLKNFIPGVRVVDNISKPLMIYCDNKVAVFLSHNNKLSGAAKHIDLRYLVV